jgi:hypothetical protein
MLQGIEKKQVGDTSQPRIFAKHVLCIECGRDFDLSSEDDSDEWYYGHDCES